VRKTAKTRRTSVAAVTNDLLQDAANWIVSTRSSDAMIAW
jgi:hypothetical protein